MTVSTFAVKQAKKGACARIKIENTETEKKIRAQSLSALRSKPGRSADAAKVERLL